jgi:ABC-type sugar transport system ATPase subunit
METVERGMKRIDMVGVTKTFPGVIAVDDVDFHLDCGKVHALIGENGAGKSTLMKVLAGIYQMNSGRILIDGDEVILKNPHDAKLHGISIIEQEFSLFPELSVYRNIFLGREYSGRLPGIINWRDIKKKAVVMLRELGLEIDVTRPISELSTSQQQLVEIAKSIFFGARFIIMDEPTSSMDEGEKERFYASIRRLKEQNVGIVYITHRLKEIFEIADDVTVMRDGKKVGTYQLSAVSQDDLIRFMVGRDLGEIFSRQKEDKSRERVVLEVKGLSNGKTFFDINFRVHAGEVLGLSGLMGAQRTEIMRSLCGLDEYGEGEVIFNGRSVRFRNLRDAIDQKIALLPEDRKREGIIPRMTVRDNILLSLYPRISTLGWIDTRKAADSVREAISEFSIKSRSPEAEIATLSGGNQQKVILSRCLLLKPELLILDEPTRGIDIGAKQEVHRLIDRIARAGVAIVMISSELPEVIGASDRIIVLHHGRIKAEYSSPDVTQEKIMQSALL